MAGSVLDRRKATVLASRYAARNVRNSTESGGLVLYDRPKSRTSGTRPSGSKGIGPGAQRKLQRFGLRAATTAAARVARSPRRAREPEAFRSRPKTTEP